MGRCSHPGSHEGQDAATGHIGDLGVRVQSQEKRDPVSSSIGPRDVQGDLLARAYCVFQALQVEVFVTAQSKSLTGSARWKLAGKHSHADQIASMDALEAGGDHSPDPEQLVMLDRGLFDAVCWMSFLAEHSGRITPKDRCRITRLLMIDLWRSRESAVFVFTADPETSLRREIDSKLTTKPGRAMTQLPRFLLSAHTEPPDARRKRGG